MSKYPMIRPLAILLVMVSCAFGCSACPVTGGLTCTAPTARSTCATSLPAQVRRSLDVGWRGEGMADTGATAQARAREAWREVWIEVVPERDGKLQINFQGEYYRKQKRGGRASGLGRSDSGQRGGALSTVTWRSCRRTACRAGGDSLDRFLPRPSVATAALRPAADVCVAVWYGAQLRQTVDVRAGQPVRVTAKFRAIGPEEESPETARHKARFANLLDLQPQTITVKVASSENARLAKIRPLPLYDGAEWAVTSRWDDNTWTNLKTRAVLLEHGHRGTFFLNDPIAERLRQGLRASGRPFRERMGQSVDEWRHDDRRALADPSDAELPEPQSDV